MAEALKATWAALASGPKVVKPLQTVQLDGQAVLKIVKHCTECQPSLVTGQLLGLDVDTTLEITDCFPFPVRSCAHPCARRSHILPRAARLRRARRMRRRARTTSWR
jgi:hypothetical protein